MRETGRLLSLFLHSQISLGLNSEWRHRATVWPNVVLCVCVCQVIFFLCSFFAVFSNFLTFKRCSQGAVNIHLLTKL